MSESNILPEGPVNLAAAEVEERVAQSTPGYHEDEDAELHMAIRMSLEKPDAATTEDTMGDNMPIGKEEQAELDQASFLCNLPPPDNHNEDLAKLHQARVNSAIESETKVEELHSSAVQLMKHFQQSGNWTTIDNAVQLMEEVIKLTPDGHIRKARRLGNLGNAFLCRFEHLGKLGDIDNAILVNQQAVDLTPDGHVDKAAWLNNLGNAFFHRFERLGKLGDIENAILVNKQAVDLAPDGHVHKAAWLNNLGNAFQSRFEHLGELRDIEDAILFKQRAVDLAPDGHADKAAWLNNFGNALQSRFEHLGELKDIENAISVNQQAVDLAPDNHAHKAAWLNNLGNAFQSRFERLGELRDIENAILVKQQAIDLAPDDHAHKAAWLNNLGNAFQSRFEHLGELGDIENAILVNQQAVDLAPDGHAHKATWLNNLGNAFQKPRDIMEATVAYKQATENISSNPFTRYDAACRWAVLCSKYQSPSSALNAYTVALEMIPQVVWFGQTIHHRYEELPKISRTINAAVAMAISVGDLPRAVEWLEAGRGIVWKQILQLHTPLDELREQHPDLANELSRISLALYDAGKSSSQNIGPENNHKSVEEEAQNCRKLAVWYEMLLQQVRELDGFGSFLRSKKFSELAPVAKNGPVVLVNVAELRCDALVLCTSGEIVAIPLPTFSYKQAETLHSRLLSSLRAHGARVNHNGDRAMYLAGEDNQDHFISVLADLWSNVVQPILSELEQALYENSHHSLPHITWCATGALAFLPLHAAGIYDDPTKNVNISDFAVSSYTTMLTAMLGSGSKPKQDPTKTPSVLIVSQPGTSGLTPLPGTVKEVEVIQRYTAPDHTCHHNNELATVEAVLGEISKHEIIHLACHAIQDMENPLNSAFVLYDGRLDLNTLMRMSLQSAELAILLASEMATDNENLQEEAIHLAAGMLAVGYPNVIATMWSIRDNDAPLIADKVYANLLGSRDNSESQAKLTPAYALHEAVKHLRKEVGEMNFVRWVPFIHFGV
ncbi:TPR-like protein [Dendrothele bispora CBS 962.96]|uniref:TPR-like protein n=1 Tax=Dendrothele bispora (strain CBS 962.96) TaxID=1314807 RepID=A0A4S8LGY7_DENBC|nr:TPR-like protein [Dendrothele bispora CBS 962.96]